MRQQAPTRNRQTKESRREPEIAGFVSWLAVCPARLMREPVIFRSRLTDVETPKKKQNETCVSGIRSALFDEVNRRAGGDGTPGRQAARGFEVKGFVSVSRADANADRSDVITRFGLGDLIISAGICSASRHSARPVYAKRHSCYFCRVVERTALAFSQWAPSDGRLGGRCQVAARIGIVLQTTKGMPSTG